MLLCLTRLERPVWAFCLIQGAVPGGALDRDAVLVSMGLEQAYWVYLWALYFGTHEACKVETCVDRQADGGFDGNNDSPKQTKPEEAEVWSVQEFRTRLRDPCCMRGP